MGAANQIEGVGIPMRATTAVEQYALIVPTSTLASDGELQCALSGDSETGALMQNAYGLLAADITNGNTVVTGIPLSAYSTYTVVTAESIAVGDLLYLAASGRVMNDVGSVIVGTALSAAAAEGDHITMIPKVH